MPSYQHRQELVKVTDIPKKPWDVVAVHFVESYPDGHYNLLHVTTEDRIS